MEARMRAYKNATYCLQDFMEIVDTKATDRSNLARYRYFVDMAGPAWNEYTRWKMHELWNDKRLMERLRQAVRGDVEEKYVDTRLLLQILWAMMWESALPK
jgi:hypothetical protein